MKTVNARFAIKSWDEKPYSEGPNLPKLTRASVVKTFTADIDGEGRVEYLMMYSSDGSASFVGLERITGRLAGRSGTFVLQRTGVFEGGLAKESYSVIHSADCCVTKIMDSAFDGFFQDPTCDDLHPGRMTSHLICQPLVSGSKAGGVLRLRFTKSYAYKSRGPAVMVVCPTSMRYPSGSRI
jgi:hypothetical protein